MNEAQLNTIIRNSIYRESWCEKIADSSGGQGSARAFDGFGIIHGLPLYYETKIQKEYKAFNFNKVEDHQWRNLLTIDKKLKVKNYTLIPLGIWESRKSFRIFFFDTRYLWNLKQSGIKSIKKAELLELVEKKAFLEIKSEVCHNNKRRQYIQDLNKLEEVIIK